MANSPIEEGEIVDYFVDNEIYENSFTNQQDNYEHVNMDIEKSAPNLSIDFDDADSLRQLLLSQVSTRKKLCQWRSEQNTHLRPAEHHRLHPKIMKHYKRRSRLRPGGERGLRILYENVTPCLTPTKNNPSSHVAVLRDVEAYQSLCEQALHDNRDAKPDLMTKATQTPQPKATVNTSAVLTAPPSRKNSAEKVKKTKHSSLKMAENVKPVPNKPEKAQFSGAQNGVGVEKVSIDKSSPKKIAQSKAVEKCCQTNCQRKRRRAQVTEGDVENSLLFPFLNLRSYSLDQSFPFKLLKHPAFANKIDPTKPLCPFQLHGRCADKDCPWQHDSDYSLSDEEIVIHFFEQIPFSCNGTEHGSYARKLLELHTLENAVRYLASQMEKS
uniref:C3H1-type domain-containing protein n=1 Tax=Ditylenchus dipsaci TaxID=166011 RepID=A0A915ETY5_9BILA